MGVYLLHGVPYPFTHGALEAVMTLIPPDLQTALADRYEFESQLERACES